MVSITLIFNTIVGQVFLLASDTFVDLGVRRLASGFFQEHIAMVAQKGRRLAGMCFRQLQSRQPDFLLKIYKLTPYRLSSMHRIFGLLTRDLKLMR